MSESTDNGTNSELFVEMLEKVTQKKKKNKSKLYEYRMCLSIYKEKYINGIWAKRIFFIAVKNNKKTPFKWSR